MLRVFFWTLFRNYSNKGLVGKCAFYNPFIMFVCFAGSENLENVFALVYVQRNKQHLEWISVAKMSDLHCSVVIKLEISMLRRSIYLCVISRSRGVNIIFSCFFVQTLLYINIRKQLVRISKVLNIFFLKSLIFLPSLYDLCFISCYFITSNIIDIKIYHNTKVLEYRPWPAGNVHYGLLRIHCTRLVLS